MREVTFDSYQWQLPQQSTKTSRPPVVPMEFLTPEYEI